LTKLKELCGEDHACEMFKHRLQECTDRVNNKPWTKETCNEELLDFLHCVDECVRELIKNIFSDSLFLIF
jgi:ubiquinol-cytochrome c reductase subunit 6